MPGNIFQALQIVPGLENISRLATYFQAWKTSCQGLENISRPGIPPCLGETHILTLGVQPSRSSVPSMSPSLSRFATFIPGSTEGRTIIANAIRPVELNSRYLPRLCANAPYPSEFATPVHESSLRNSHTHSDHVPAVGRRRCRHARTVWPLALESWNSHTTTGHD